MRVVSKLLSTLGFALRFGLSLKRFQVCRKFISKELCCSPVLRTTKIQEVEASVFLVRWFFPNQKFGTRFLWEFGLKSQKVSRLLVLHKRYSLTEKGLEVSFFFVQVLATRRGVKGRLVFGYENQDFLCFARVT